MRTLLKHKFSTVADLLSTKNIKKFETGEFPNALTFARPFCIISLKLVRSTTNNGITVAT